MTTKQHIKLGDAIAAIAKALRIPHCELCERRRRILNEIKTVGVRETVKRLRMVGFSSVGKSAPRGEAEGSWPVEKIIKEMEDCCGENKLQNHGTRK